MSDEPITLETINTKLDVITSLLQEYSEMKGLLVAVTEQSTALRSLAMRLEKGLADHDTWAKSTHLEANKELAQNRLELESRQKEFRVAAESIGGLLLRLHERMDKLVEPRSEPKRRKKTRGGAR